ncbi:site-specific integrase [Porifericola rhodea]|uniref:tyrosine-type recombinase/integrase n=1 Tax=Porifericola rhodea TaxID=930972 RepID=UPI0026668D37|nr:site-specific integrase [Porifericola rhodea]WKN29745.1 site-specific integrase [Porifericola rhodea]
MKGNFLTYVRTLAEKKRSSDGNYGNWKSMLKFLEEFAPSHLTFAQVDSHFVEDFKSYLDKDAKKKNNKGLSQNSKYSYFSKFKAALKQAEKDEIINRNPAKNVKGFEQEESEREFLTLEELEAIVETECEIPILKSAFLFSCLTGIRWADIEKLKWSEVQYSQELGYFIRFRQKKTKGAETLPISKDACLLLGERKDRDELVFKGLEYSSENNDKLQRWIDRAKVTKDITFHCARHTYATLQLTLGTDIYTVSKMLCHRELKTTQVYAKIIDDKKKEAANKIKLAL